MQHWIILIIIGLTYTGISILVGFTFAKWMGPTPNWNTAGAVVRSQGAAALIAFAFWLNTGFNAYNWYCVISVVSSFLSVFFFCAWEHRKRKGAAA